MKLFARILLGAFVAFVIICASQVLAGLLAIWSPFPRSWWAHHPYLVVAGSEAIVLIPCIGILGFVLWKLYPVRAVLGAFLSVALALLVVLAQAFKDPEPLTPTAGLLMGLYGPFLVGPPLIVALIGHLRSNSRWNGP